MVMKFHNRNRINSAASVWISMIQPKLAQSGWHTMDRWGIFSPESELNKSVLTENELKCNSFSCRYFAALKAAEYSDIDETLQRQTLAWFEKFVNMYTACDTWYEVSCRTHENFLPCSGDAHLNWKDKGYRTVLDLLQV